MNTPYENQLIGAFLYGLGLTIGKKSFGEPHGEAVSLLQQTPLDPSLGDALLANAERAYLIEFKRDRSQLDTEHAKRDAIVRGIPDDLRRTAHDGHLLAFADAPSAGSVPLRFLPYFNSDGVTYDFRKFAAMFADGSGGADARKFQKYLRFLLEQSGSKGGSGLMVTQNKAGDISLQILPDIADLNMPVSRALNMPPPEPPQPRISRGIGR